MPKPSDARESPAAGPTAAMVIAAGGERLASTPQGRAMLARFDTAHARELAEMLMRTHPPSVRHLVLRKWRTAQHLARIATVTPDAARLVIVPGAGLSSLALDWCASHPDAHAIEIDYDHVGQKRAAIDAAGGPAARRIACIRQDLRDIPALSAALAAQGWDPGIPCTWVIEGLSYYLEHANFAALLRLARGTHPDTRIASEYGGSRSGLRAPVREAITRYHQSVARAIGMDDLHETDIAAVARDAGLRVEIDECAADIELLIADGTRIFSDAHDSSMHVALLAPDPAAAPSPATAPLTSPRAPR